MQRRHPVLVAELECFRRQRQRFYAVSHFRQQPGEVVQRPGGPLRRRAQRLVNKRFNRARYDAEATVAAFADAMRASADLPGVQRELVTTVNQAFEPVHVSVWVNVT